MQVRILVAVALLVAAVVTLSAQRAGPPGGRGQPPFPGGRFGGPVRDNSEPATGTARISGRVVSADAGTPIRRAQIRLSSRDARVSRQIVTDADGRYEFAALPAGRYRLSVSKSGYVSLEYGQARPFETGRPLDLIDGQILERLDFSVPRGSVIAGRVVDELGEPVTDAQVQAMRYQLANGERQLVNAGRVATTDDLGQFRIFGLMPGDYLVRASMRANADAGAAPTGGVAPDADGPLGYPGTYYPGVTDLAQAQAVTVSLGQELSSVAFSLVPARLSRISGTVTGSDGRPLAGALVMLRVAGGGGTMGARMNVGRNRVQPDGTFRLANVPPGDYILHAQQSPQSVENQQNAGLSALEFASVPVHVSGDIDNLSITTAAGARVAGRVVFEGGTANRPGLRTVQVTASSPPGVSAFAAFAGRGAGNARVNNDGTFELHGLSGPQVIRAGGIPPGWTLKSITLEGADITDAPFDFNAGADLTGMLVTLTDRVTELSGTVNDSRGLPAGDYVLVVFSEDARRWGPQSRYVTTARPNQNGAFSVKGLPPGRYLAVAVPSLENGMENDSALLTRLRIDAETFSLAEGQSLVVALPLNER